jgi:hypothetical protein
MRLKSNHPALSERRTIHVKYRQPVLPDSNVLKPATNNSKLGKGSTVIRKGHWRGMPMFVVTLQERATCPSDCMRWAECFGNGMAYAHRFEHGPELEDRIRAEVDALARMYPQGFVVRLHILGDFYSTDYVGMWFALLAKHAGLRIFGYTARHGADPIWSAIRRIRQTFADRFWVRQSRNGQPNPAEPELIYATEEDAGSGITCPEQTGQTESCLTCGLCWSVKSNIKFVDHDKLAKQRKAQ